MNQCKTPHCASHAINPATDLYLCDVCFWRKRAEDRAQPVQRTLQTKHEASHWAEEYECCMMALDSAGVTRVDETGTIYSLWGRILAYARSLQPYALPKATLIMQARLIEAEDKLEALDRAQPVRTTGEAAAQALYESWHSLPGYVPWEDGGNSDMQEKARALAQQGQLL